MSLVLRLGFTLLVACALDVSGAPAGAEDYPNRPIRFIVPFAPGGGGDIVVRTLAQKLNATLGQPVVVDNRSGAGGNVGTDLAAKSSPDGYTILMANVAPIAINVSLYKKLPYDPVKDFAPVSLIAVFPNVLVVYPSLPAKSVKELIALARSRPGQLAYASAGNGSTTHLAAELFKNQAAIDMIHVPYKGGGPALVDLIAGQVNLYFGSMPAALPHVRSGKLRALAVTSARRSRAAPELPTVAESGFPGFEAATWIGVLAPAGTPPPIVTRLNREIVTILQQPDLEERLSAQGAEPVTNTPAQFAAYIRSEIRKWSQVVTDSGARVD